MSTTQVTTAAALGSFRKELLEQGFTADEAFALSRDALSELQQYNGICVRTEDEVPA